MITGSVKNQIGDSQLTIEFLDRYKPLEIERRKFNPPIFFGVPLTTKIEQNPYY